MLHFVMGVLYDHFTRVHRLREDWKPNLILSSKRYLKQLPQVQVTMIASSATDQATELFGPALGELAGIDIRHAVIAFAQMVLKLVEQHRYRYSDDSLVLQSIGIVSEAVEERVADWNYQRQPVRSLYQNFMKRVDGSKHFQVEAEQEGVDAPSIL